MYKECTFQNLEFKKGNMCVHCCIRNYKNNNSKYLKEKNLIRLGTLVTIKGNVNANWLHLYACHSHSLTHSLIESAQPQD